MELDVEYEGATIDPWGNPRIGFSATGEFEREAFGMTWNQVMERGWLVSKKFRLESCTGRPDLLFVEYFHCPEPTSGNSAMCPSDGISAILWFPSGRTVSFYLEAARVPRDAVPGQALTWSLAVQVWEKPWRKPTCEKDRSGMPRGLWAMCGDGPLGFAVPAPTPAR